MECRAKFREVRRSDHTRAARNRNSRLLSVSCNPHIRRSARSTIRCVYSSQSVPRSLRTGSPRSARVLNCDGQLQRLCAWTRNGPPARSKLRERAAASFQLSSTPCRKLSRNRHSSPGRNSRRDSQMAGVAGRATVSPQRLKLRFGRRAWCWRVVAEFASLVLGQHRDGLQEQEERQHR